jgi:hypothetical protein
VALAVGRHRVDRARLPGERGEPVLAEPRPGLGRDDVVEAATLGGAGVVAVPGIDGSPHDDDLQVGVDDHDAGLRQQAEDRLGDLRRVAEVLQLAQRAEQHQAIPMPEHRRVAAQQ